MEIEFSDNEIVIEKELTNLDKFVKRFVEVLEKHDVKYVVISGYVAIFFNRTRHTEDIDAFIEDLTEKKFIGLWGDLEGNFDCLNTSDPKDAYEYLREGMALRFAEKGSIIPNFELKFPKTKLDRYALSSRVKVKAGEGYSFYTSNLEMQIAFKLHLGSDKDIEDAKHLWTMFKDNLNKEILKYFMELIKVKNKGVLDGL